MYYQTSIFEVILGIALLIVLLSLVFGPSKSRTYRKFLVDMYVAAKVKHLAKKDNLDLAVEAIDFKLWRKKEKLTETNMGLDNSVEEELKEKLAEGVTKKEVPRSGEV